MYLIPLVRTSRCISSCFLYTYNPLLAITISEISSFIIPILYVNNHNINNKVNIDISNYLYNFYYNLFGFIFILNFDTNYAYDLIEGKATNRKLIYDFKPFFSDGFRCDIDGNIWTSAGKAIKCFNSNFELIGQIKIPELVSNCEFGGKDGNILYITATTSLYSINLNQKGAKFG